MPVFPPNSVVGNALILECLTPTALASYCRYQVRFLCCGHEGEIGHRSLRHRRATNAFNCINCGRKAAQESQRQRHHAPQAPKGPPLTSFAHGPTWPIPGQNR